MASTNTMATGIVAEYNPFHNGHLYHLQQAKKITGQPVIVVMSGSFMQRGEPACADKWLRAELACSQGADLILELPAVFSLRSAQFFAHGAISILKACGCVNYICCGTETPNYDFMESASAITTSESQLCLQNKLKQGQSYAAACSELLPQLPLKSPNDILALEYSKALLGSNITPIFLQRRNAGYNDTTITGSIASATAIRKSIHDKNQEWLSSVPETTALALQKIIPGYNENLLWQLICYRLRALTAEEIAKYCQCSEGLENLLKSATNAPNLAQALSLCTNKRYSTSRIRRLFLQLLMDKPRNILEQQNPAYLRVLAFNDNGRTLLKTIKQRGTLPLLTKLGRYPERNRSQAFGEQLHYECCATDLWSMVQYTPYYNNCGRDYLQSPIYIQ